MIFLTFCLVLIATSTLYTQAKPTHSAVTNERQATHSAVTNERQDSDPHGDDAINSLQVSSRSSDQETHNESNQKPSKHKKHHESCGDGQGHRREDGESCAKYKLDEQKNPTVPVMCTVGTCHKGVCISLKDVLCSNM
uniref:Evasin n=1 Tax=Rhipicephalus appendiculatus TaxID=34631 RepID=A0A131Z5W1_RHIAP